MKSWQFILATVVAITCFTLTLHFNASVFPELNFRSSISKEQVEAQTSTYAQQLGIQTKRFTQATVLTGDGIGYTYLSQHYSASQAAQYMAGHGVVVWQTRYFIPLTVEEYSIQLEPDGQLSGFSHIIAEDASGARLSQPTATQQATSFLTQQLGPAHTYQLLESSSINRPNRQDWSFTFEDQNFKAVDATARIDVLIQGDQIDGFYHYLKVPETWIRGYETRRSSNDAAQVVGDALLLVLVLCGLGFSIGYVKQFRLPTVFFVILALILLFAILDPLNSLPAYLAGFPTTQSLGGFLSILLLGSVVSSATLYLPWALGALLGGLRLAKDRLTASAVSSYLPPFRSPAMRRSLLAGIVVGSICLALQLAIYALGKWIGFWAPPEINLDSTASSFAPWLTPALIGMIAAITEELLFRHFAIQFLRRYLRSLPVAIILSSIAWGIIHSNYPVDPWFARGLEVAVIGLILSATYLRFGILASIAAHYIMDAFLTSESLLIAHAPAWQLTIAFALTGLPALAYVTSKLLSIAYGNATETPSLFLPKKPFAFSMKKIRSYDATPRALFALLLLAVVSGAVIAGTPSSPTINISATQATAIARNTLQTQGIDTDQYRTTTTFYAADYTAASYVTTQGSSETFDALVGQYLQPDGYNVRFYKILTKEEYTVFVPATNAKPIISHTLSEDAPHSTLSQAAAVQLGEQELTNHSIDPATLHLVNATATVRKARTDYALTWESLQPVYEDMHVRYDVTVLGNEATGFTSYFKLPEQFERSQSQVQWFNILAVVSILVLATLLLVRDWKFSTELQKDAKRYWRQGLMIGLLITFLSLLGLVNALPGFWLGYGTTVPFAQYLLQSIPFSVLPSILFGLFGGYSSAFAIAIYRKMIGEIHRPTASQVARYCIVGTLTALVGYAGSQLFSPNTTIAISGSVYDELVALCTGNVAAMAIALPLSIYGLLSVKRYMNWPAVITLSFVLTIMVAATTAHSMPELLKMVVPAIAALAFTWIAIRFWLGTNPWPYIWFLVVASVLPMSLQLIAQPENHLRIDGLIGLSIVFVPTAVAFAALHNRAPVTS